ncbi:MAG: phage major capsid protein [Devosia sp.]
MDRLEFKAAITVDEEGHIEGIAWPFGSPDRVGDEIMPGSFAKSHGPLPMLAFHDQAETVGVWDTITETASGLMVKGRLLVKEVARAAEMRALIREKAVGGLSIGFSTRKAAPRKGGGRTITALDLLEISIVSVPAHPGARITSAKADVAGKEATMADNEQGAAPEIAELTTKMGEFETTLKAFKQPDLTKIEDRLAKVEAKANRPGADNAADTDEATNLERKAFGSYLRLGNQLPADEAKSLTVSNDEQGGYLAPAEMSSEIIEDLIEVSPIRSLASVRNITSPSVKYPKRTGITNAQWEGELEESEESTVTFGQSEVTARKLMTFVDISNELLADSGGTAEAEVRRALADDFGQKEGLAFLSGDGVKQPEGMMTNSDIPEFLNGHATIVSPDKLIGMMYSLPGPYRNNGSWLINGTALGVIRTLKDTNGAYIWQPGLQAGQPSTLLGRPVVEAVDMPDIASGTFPIMFGDFNRGYRIVDRLAMSVLVNPYSLATKGVTRIHATRRVGGRVIQPAALRKLKMAVS